MTLYAQKILPALVDLSMRKARLAPYRTRIAGMAEGRVLEIGFGTGANLPFYSIQARELIGIDPSPPLLQRGRERIAACPVPVSLVEGRAESIPLSDGTVDTAVMTWTGCSIADPEVAYQEIRRVLAPYGRLLFVEHGRSPEESVARWQDRLTPIWCRVAGGCHLNRAFDRLLTDGGFRLERLSIGPMAGFRPLTAIYEGVAAPA